MYALVVLATLSGFLDGPPSIAQLSEVTEGPPLGTWRIVDIIDEHVSCRRDKTVQITDNRLVFTGGEYSIVSIIPTQRPAAIDLWADGWTYRGIYQQEGKQLRICVQFYIEGNAKTSVRPKSFKEADRAKIFGPTLYVLELK